MDGYGNKFIYNFNKDWFIVLMQVYLSSRFLFVRSL